MLHEVAAGAELTVVADRGGGGGDLAERSPRSTTRGPARGGERLAAVVPALYERLAGGAVVAKRHEVVAEIAALHVGHVADRGGGGGDLAALAAVVATGAELAVVADGGGGGVAHLCHGEPDVGGSGRT